MPDQTTKEIAKATKEVAKTSRVAIKKLSPWIGRVIGEPIGVLADVLVEGLNLYKAERAVLLNERWVAFMLEHGITEPRPVPLRFAIPIIENASIEENDTLFDLWTNLLVAGSNPDQPGSIKAAFIGIIQGMDPLDAKVLDVVFRGMAPRGIDITTFSFVTRQLIKYIHENWSDEISEADILVSIENLMRLRCVQPFMQDKELQIPNVHTGRTHGELVSLYYGSERFVLTHLGKAFVDSCMPESLVASN